MSEQTPGPAAIAESFRRFARREATPGDSPVYNAICHIVADSPVLLELAAVAGPGQPAPNLLLAAIHFFVRRNPGNPLASYFPSVGGSRTPDAALGGEVERFCAEHRAGIASLMRTRFVQTNEVRRTACLLPAFAAVHAESGAPLALLEVGCSAGLNLLFDRYSYDYGDGTTHGRPDAAVHVTAEARTPVPAPSVALPPVSRRMGVDLNPLDVANADDLEWLQALTWPEHADRRDLLGAAAAVARDELPPLIRGDAVDELERMAAAVPGDEALVVFAAFVLHQLPPERRSEFRRALERLGRTRPTWFVVMGFADFVASDSFAEDGSTGVWIARFEGDSASARRVVRCHPHGRWLEFLPESAYEPLPGV